MKSLLAAIVLLAIATAVFAQSGAELKREMRESYRLVVDTTGLQTPLKVRFPRTSVAVNEIPTSIDSIRTTGSEDDAVFHVQLVQRSADVNIAWYIWSPCFPAGVDTVWTNLRFPAYDFFGCPVDSVVCVGNAVKPPDISVFVGD